MAEADRSGPTVAVIGLGSMGMRHAANAQELGARVVGVEPDPSRRDQAVATLPQLRFVKDVVDAAAVADAAVIASPSSRHADDLRVCLSAGCHVLVEKPLADRTDEMRALMQQARKSNRIVAVAQNLRFHPAVMAARSILDAGEFGPVLSAVSIGASYLPEWRPNQDYRTNYAADPKSGGVMFDWIHEVDLLAHLLGPFRVQGAAAAGQRVLEMESEEEAGLLLRHTQGCLSMVLLSYTTRPPLRKTTLFGPNGRLEIDIPARTLLQLDAHGNPVREEAFGGQHTDDYKSELQDFLSAIRTGGPPRCSGEEALEILQGVLDARRIAGLPQHGS